MRPDVHAAALRSAAKLVLGMASFATITTGCSSETTEETASNDSAVITADTKKDCDGDKPATKPASSTRDEAASPPPTSCGAVLHSAFPNPDGFTFEPHAQSAAVVSCCRAELAETDGMSQYRWDCCMAFDPAEQTDPNTEWPTTVSHGPGLGLACTPWGPPVPPSMQRKTRRSPARRHMTLVLSRRGSAEAGTRDMAAFIAQAVA